MPGHGCGFAVSLIGLSPDTFKLFVGGAAEHPVSSAMPVLPGGDNVVRPSRVSAGSAGCALQSSSLLWGQPQLQQHHITLLAPSVLRRYGHC